MNFLSMGSDKTQGKDNLEVIVVRCQKKIAKENTCQMNGRKMNWRIHLDEYLKQILRFQLL